MTLMQWGFVISLFSPLATLVGFAWHSLSNKGFSAARFQTLEKNVEAAMQAVTELSKASIKQQEESKYQNQFNTAASSDLAKLRDEQARMLGREEGRHRDR